MPELCRTVSQQLAESLVGVQDDSDILGSEPQLLLSWFTPRADEAYRTVARSTSATLNRELFLENQRRLAAELLSYTCLLPVLVLIIALLVLCGLSLYVRGWSVLFHYAGRQCDKPLEVWLFAMLAWPTLQCQSYFTGERSNIQGTRALFTFVLLSLGFAWLNDSKTCHETNPVLYEFAETYLLYQTLAWAVLSFLCFGLVAVVLQVRRLDVSRQGHGAARAGIVDELECVRYSVDMLYDDKEPVECCICQEQFEIRQVLRRSPCSHVFHGDCLGEWLQLSRSCPLCRTDLQQCLDAVTGAEHGSREATHEQTEQP